VDPDRVDVLEVVGGSEYPFSEPWGQLRRCPACGAWFNYTRDHDNAIGYVADPPSLERLDGAGARKLAEGALAVARQMDSYFAARGDRRYEAEIARLVEAIAGMG
jgi:hypothetical protein